MTNATKTTTERMKKINALLSSAWPYLQACPSCGVVHAPSEDDAARAVARGVPAHCTRCADLIAIGAQYRCDGCGRGTVRLDDKTMASQRACVRCDAELISATVPLPRARGLADEAPPLQRYSDSRDASEAFVHAPVVRLFVQQRHHDEMVYARVVGISRTTVRLAVPGDECVRGYSLDDGRADTFTGGEPRPRIHGSDLPLLRRVVLVEMGDGRPA